MPRSMMDSLQKRVLFLQRVVEDLGLANVRCVHARAEQASHDAQHRARYDFAFARAVASLPTLAEYCLPFVRTGGARDELQRRFG
jgi:16S rRNA (guanine527-N7)-methyltransferase